jgi:phenylacetate-CoA ligase
VRGHAVLAAAHDLAARAVLQPLQRVERRVRPGARPALRACQAGLAFRDGAAAWDAERRRRWILARLRETARRACAESPFYRARFQAAGVDPHADFGFDDFARLAPLTREDVRVHAAALVSPAVPRAQLRRDATGGSTGEPTEVWLGPEERGWQESGNEHYMRRLGVPRGSRTAYLWGHHLDPVARAGWRERARDFADNVRWLDCFRLSAAALARHHEALQRQRPARLVAYASALAALAEEVLARGWQARYPTRCCVTGAERLTAGQRALVRAAFGRPVHARYGSRDAGLVAFQVDPEASGYEVDWANTLVEPLGAGPVAPIVLTKLHADGMPMLRYRVGDLGQFPAGSRPGHPVFVLDDVLGRELDRLWLGDGRWVHGVELPHLMKDHAVREFQVVQRADLSVVVHVVPAAGFGPGQARRILATLADNLPGLPLSLEVVEAIARTPAGKLRPVVSHAESARAPEVVR